MCEIELKQNKLKNIVKQSTYSEEQKKALAEDLWFVLQSFEKTQFQTVKGVTFTYEIKGGEMLVDRKKKSITRASVVLAFENLIKQGGMISGPKKLGTFGASYLYPIFMRLGFIKERQEEYEF